MTGRSLRSRMVFTRILWVAMVFAVAVGCSSNNDASEVEPPTDDESVYGSFAIDPPAGDEVVLTIEGATRVSFTMDQLFARATTEVTLFEPFVRRDETFAVIALHELLEEAGLRDDDHVETVALNDYRYSQRVGDLRQNAALLAVSRNGEPIPMDAGGPIRIVFANDSAFAGELDAWNWSLYLIQVSNS